MKQYDGMYRADLLVRLATLLVIARSYAQVTSYKFPIQTV